MIATDTSHKMMTIVTGDSGGNEKMNHINHRDRNGPNTQRGVFTNRHIDIRCDEGLSRKVYLIWS